MNISSFLFFILFFIYSFNVFAGPWRSIRNLVTDIIQRDSNRNFSELEKELESLIGEAFSEFQFHGRGRFMENIVANVSGDFEDNVDVAAIFYSLAIKSDSLDSSSKRVFGMILEDMNSRLNGSKRFLYYDIEEILSSPQFFLPSIGKDPHNYREMVFGYIKRNLPVIYERGYGSKIILRWWGYSDFRELIFNSIERRYLNDSDLLLKWWKHDKVSGTGRFRDFAAPYIVRGNGSHGVFWETFLKAVNESDELLREFEFLTEKVRKFRTLNPRKIRAFNTRVIRNWKSWEIKVLTSRQIRALTSKQIKSFTPEQVRAFTPNQMGYFTPEQIRTFTPEQFRGFSSLQLSKVSLRGLNSQQVQAIPDEVVRELPPRRRRDLLSPTPSSFEYHSHFSDRFRQPVGVQQ